MFTYCTQVLHLAEHAAYNRIEAARAARRFPAILKLLADGSVHLSAIRLLAPHLTQENHTDVLREASHKSKRVSGRAPLHAPGKRSQLVLFRARGDYGCVWTTYARRTDAPVVYRVTRITRQEVAAPKRGSAAHRPPRLLALHQRPSTI